MNLAFREPDHFNLPAQVAYAPDIIEPRSKDRLFSFELTIAENDRLLIFSNQNCLHVEQGSHHWHSGIRNTPHQTVPRRIILYHFPPGQRHKAHTLAETS